MQDEVKVTQADIDAWEIYGPKIFHCEMTGPEALARHRHQAEQRGGEVVAWQGMDSAPVGEYVLFKFDGPFLDTDSPGIAVGKITGPGIWLTAIWAATSAHWQPVAWAPLPIAHLTPKADAMREALVALKAVRPFVNPNTFPGTATPVREKIEAAIAALGETA